MASAWFQLQVPVILACVKCCNPVKVTFFLNDQHWHKSISQCTFSAQSTVKAISGWNATHHVTSKTVIPCYDTSCFYFHRGSGNNEAERTVNAEIRKAEFLAVHEACRAIFWPKREPLSAIGSLQRGSPFLSLRRAPQHRIGICKQPNSWWDW